METLWKGTFSAADVAVGYLLYAITKDLKGGSERVATIAAACWLLNPMAINVCTRGNADAIICWLVLLCVRLLQRGCIIQSGAVYGIAVHFRIFPVILAPTFLLLLNRPSIRAPLGYRSSALACQATFSLIAVFTFFALTGVFWLLYGYPFLHESYLYHILSRLDPRHNFSPYFYALYITPSVAWTILFAVSQITVQLSMSWRFASDFVFCACIQTWAFVTFNKVCTAHFLMVSLAAAVRCDVDDHIIMGWCWRVAAGLPPKFTGCCGRTILSLKAKMCSLTSGLRG